MFGERQPAFLKPDRSLQRAYGRATELAASRNPERAQGTDSLDLLVAALEANPVAQLLRRLGVDPASTAHRAAAARLPVDEPGLTSDARRVVERVAQRALDLRRDPNVTDLLIGLAATPGPAREALVGSGLDEARLLGSVD